MQVTHRALGQVTTWLPTPRPSLGSTERAPLAGDARAVPRPGLRLLIPGAGGRGVAAAGHEPPHDPSPPPSPLSCPQHRPSNSTGRRHRSGGVFTRPGGLCPSRKSFLRSHARVTHPFFHLLDFPDRNEASHLHLSCFPFHGKNTLSFHI